MGVQNSAAPCVNSWLTSLWHAVQIIKPQATWQEIYALSGVPFAYVAAESWFDPATIHCHPRLPIPPVPALQRLRQLDASRWAAHGIAVTQYWLSTSQELAEFLMHPYTGVVIIWGVDGPEYGVLLAHTGAMLTIQQADKRVHTIDIATLYGRGGIDLAILATTNVVATPPYALLSDAVELLAAHTIVRFDTPRHPLRDDQAWYIGLGAFEVMALAADHAAPLALVSTHVATIVHDFWQRADVAQQLLLHWADLHPLPAGKQLLNQSAEAFVDAQFFLNILCHQFPRALPQRALNHAEGDLIAAACRDVRLVLIDALRDMQQAVQIWQTHCDA